MRGSVKESACIGTTSTLLQTWDKKGRLVGIDTPYFQQQITPDGFDAVGNLLTYRFTDALGEVVFQATYDDLYQLTHEKGIKSHQYKNDSIHNRLQKDAKSYTVDNLNRLLDDTDERYRYDKNGNLLERTSDTHTLTFSYDALDRLVKVSNGQNEVTYQYDSFHRRLARCSSDKLEYFLHHGQREIGLFDPAQAKITEFRLLGLGKGAELGAAIAIELQDKHYCPIHDHRGNMIALVDPETGKLQECYRYTAFGEREIYDNTGKSLLNSKINNPWGFASKRHDRETGFIYFSRRYYAPLQGRWVTTDPIGFADGPNLYAYVHNNPLTMFDLYGLFDEVLGLLDSFFAKNASGKKQT